MMGAPALCEGQILTGSLFNEPMRVETVQRGGDETWVLGLVGLQTERFRKVTLSAKDLASLRIQEASYSYKGDGALLRLGLQAYSLGIAYEFDPYFGLSISRIDPLPHQLEAVYDSLPLGYKAEAAMFLQAGGRANALRALLAAEHQRGPEFLRLANALSALYPKDSEEKRLLDTLLLAVPR